MQTVLIVDNSRVVRKLLQEKLVYGLRLDPEITTTLQETRECIERDPSAFFVAVAAPTLSDAPNGEVVEYLLTRHIPVIILTASSVEETQQIVRPSQQIIEYVVKSGRDCFDQVITLVQQIQRNQQIKILVVTSSVSSRDHITRLLDAHRYSTLEAENGEHALNVLKFYSDVKLIITDFEMPLMNGPELIQQVRKQFTTQQLVILGLFSHEAHLASKELLQAGADDFLAVPFYDEEFYFRITRMLETLE